MSVPPNAGPSRLTAPAVAHRASRTRLESAAVAMTGDSSSAAAPLAALARSSAALNYDALPAHSTLLREVTPAGGIKITAAAGDVGAAARGDARRSSAAAAALFAA